MKTQDTQKYYKVVRKAYDGRLISSWTWLPDSLVVTYRKGYKTYAPAGKLLIFCSLQLANKYHKRADGRPSGLETWEVEVGTVTPVHSLLSSSCLRRLETWSTALLTNRVDSYFRGSLSALPYAKYTPLPGTVGTDRVILKHKV